MSEIKFLNTGKTLQDRNEEENLNSSSAKSDILPLGIKMPLERGTRSYESLFKMNTNIFDQVSNNFKTFLMTKKGELLCKPNFGTILHEIYNKTDLEKDDIENIVMEEIQESTREFFPFINLIDFESKEVTSNNNNDANYMLVTVRYSIQGFEDRKNSLELRIRRSV
tara:strand:+ start:335 stop:835 length:501 start_codon:yes stop_codon:yes gene_type:complete